MRKILIIVTMMVISIILTACNEEGTVAIPPTFTGIRIDNSETVSGDEYITFYRGKQDTVLVEITLNNPSNAPIRSVKINGYTYLSTKFTEESTNSVLYFELNVGSNLAQTIYAVDQISYLDGENTIGVPVTANNSFRIYVFKDVPTVERENYSLSRHGISIDFNITDIDNIILPNTLVAEIYSGETLIETKELNSGFINVAFTDLLANRLYEVKILADFDRDDNNGLQSNEILYNGTYSTLSNGLPSASFENLDVTSNLVTFDVSFNDLDNVVVADGLSVVIYDGETLIDEVSFTDSIQGLHFEDLLNDKEYVLKILADYDLLDGLGTREDNILAVSSFSTLPRQVPTPKLENMKLLENSIDFDIEIDDETGIIDINTLIANLYLEDVFVNSVEIEELHADFQVNNLFANNEFTIELVADYDLNDGLGVQVQKIVFSETYSTSANEVPSILVDELMVEQGYVTLALQVSDPNSTLMGAIEVALMENDTKVDSTYIDINSTEIVFAYATEAGIPYYIEFIADYNLEDGTGALYDQILRRVVAYTAEAKAPIAEISNIETTTSSITFDVTVTDADNTVVTNQTIVYIYYGDTLIGQETVPVAETTVSFTGLLSNNQYSIVIESDFNLDDGSGVLDNQELLQTDIVTNTKTLPTSAITNIDTDDESITLDVEIIDPDLVVDDTKIYVKLFHQGVEVESQSIDNGENFDITFTDLLSDNNYSVEVYVDYDLDDGNDVIDNYLVGESVISTDRKYAPTATFVFSESDEESITVDIRVEDSYGVLVPTGDLKAVLMLNDAPAGEEYPLTVGLNSNITFSSVYANERYYIDIVADYDLNDGDPIFDDEILASDFVLTDAFDDVTALIGEVSATHDSITIDVIVSDPSDIVTTNLQAAIYLDIEDPAIATIPLVVGENIGKTFTGIDSDTIYTVQIETDYDNNEMTSPVSGAVLDFVELTTLPLSPPSANITSITPSYNSFTTTIDVIDDNDTVVPTTLKAYLFEEDGVTPVGLPIDLVDGENDLEFLSLNSNNTYVLEVITSYDLNDEAGVQPDYQLVTSTVTTLEKTVPNVTVLSEDINYDEIVLLVELDDEFGVMIPDTYQAHLNIDGGAYEATIDLTTSEIHFDLSGFIADYPFEVVITGQYDLDDGDGPQTGEITVLPYRTLAFSAPTATIDDLTINQDTIDVTINVDDSSETVIDNLEAQLLDKDGTLLETLPLVDGENAISFTHTVNEGELYKVIVYADYNLRNGSGDALEQPLAELIATSFNKLIPQASITNIVEGKETLTFDVTILDNDNVIVTPGTKVVLYKDGTMVDEEDLALALTQSVSFTGLQSNTEYTIEVITTFDNGDGNNTYTNYQVLTQTSSTVEKVVPTAELLEDTVTEDDIIIDVNYTDPDGVITDRYVNIFDAESNLIETKNVLTDANDNLLFTNLFASENYTIEVYLSYNLNDGQGEKTDVLVKTITIETDSLVAPSGLLTIVTQGTDSVSIEVEITDDDSVLTNNLRAVLLLGTTVEQTWLISTTPGIYSHTFNTLDSGTEYKIEIRTDYDLEIKAGESLDQELDSAYFVTNPLSAPILSITDITSDTDSVTFTSTISDVDDTGENFVAKLWDVDASAFLAQEFVLTLAEETKTFDTGLVADHEYQIVLFGDYDLEDGETAETNYEFDRETVSTVAKQLPTFTIDNELLTYDGLTIEFTLDDVDSVLDTGILTAGLYVNDVMITEKVVLTNQIYFDLSGFLANFDFELRITADYNLDDGVTIETDGTLVSLEYTTLSYAAPTAIFNDILANQEGIVVDVLIIDDDGRSTGNLEAILYDETGTEIGRTTLTVGSNTVVFDYTTFTYVLSSQEFYHVVVESDYDLLDGTGEDTDVILAEGLIQNYNNLTPEAEVSNIVVTGDSISFDVDVYDADTTITGNSYAQLYLDGVYQSQEDISAGPNSEVFNTLLSNREYEVRIITDYNNGDGNGTYTTYLMTSETITTESLVVPTATITVDTINPTEIILDVVVADDSGITTARVLNLYSEGGTLLDTEVLAVGDNFNVTFSGLIGLTSYTVKIVMTYDLSDGDGSLPRTSNESELTTTASSAPTGIISNVVGTTKTILVDYDLIDDDSVTTERWLRIYDDGDLLVAEYAIIAGLGQQYTFDNLPPASEYTIRIEATYDINDSNGVQTDIALDSFDSETGSFITFDYEDNNIGTTTAAIDIVVDDYEDIITSSTNLVATLFQGATEIGTYIVTTDIATTISMANLLSDYEYTLEVEATYNVGDGNGDVTALISSETFTTKPLLRPEVTIDPFGDWTIGATVQIEIDFGTDDDNVANNTEWTAYLYVNGSLEDTVDIDASFAGNPEDNTDVAIDFTGYTVIGGESYTVIVTAMADYNEVAGQGEVETAMDSVAGIDAGN